MSGVKVENVKSGETILEISQNTEHIIFGVLPAMLVVVRLEVWSEMNRKQSKSMVQTPCCIQTDIMSVLRLKSGTGGFTMAELMIRFDDLRRYCEKRRCGSVSLEYIKQMPTIEAEPVRHGRWIPIEYDSYADGAPVWDKWECSECGHEHKGEEDTLTAFCPDCGARMNLRTPTEAQLDEADNVMMRGADNG